MSKNIVLTGGNGFVGSLLINILKKNGHLVTNIDLKSGHNIENWNKVKKVSGFDVLIHLAAKSYVPASYQVPHDFYSINLIGTLNMLELCRLNNASMIYTSSYVYGIPQYLPIDESHPLKPLNPYSHTKILGEELCRSYYENFGVPITILRPSNIFGYGQDDRFLIPTIINQINSKNIKLKDKNPKRDYIYVKDVVDAYVKCLDNHDDRFRIFNIGSGESHSVEDIANMIIKVSKKNVSVQFSKSDREVEVMDTRYSILNANKFLKWEPKYSLRSGVKEMIMYKKTYKRSI